MWRRIVGGASLVIFGASMLVIAWSYPTGTVVRMDYGFMPQVISAALILFGLATIISDLRQPDLLETETPQWRAIIYVSAAVVLFVTMIEPTGLVPAMFCAVAASMLASDRAGLVSVLVYSTIVAFAGWLVFIVALGLPLSVFGR